MVLNTERERKLMLETLKILADGCEVEIGKLKKEHEEIRKLVEGMSQEHNHILNRYTTIRSRLAVLITLHKDELNGMGLKIEDWIKDLEQKEV